jgi:hypothetical protein
VQPRVRETVSQGNTPRKNNAVYLHSQSKFEELTRLKIRLQPTGSESLQKARQYLLDLFYSPKLDEIFTAIFKIIIASVFVDSKIPSHCRHVHLKLWEMQRFVGGVQFAVYTLSHSIWNHRCENLADAQASFAKVLEKQQDILLLDASAVPLQKLLHELLSLILCVDDCPEDRLLQDWERTVAVWTGMMNRLTQRKQDSGLSAQEWAIYQHFTINT